MHPELEREPLLGEVSEANQSPATSTPDCVLAQKGCVSPGISESSSRGCGIPSVPVYHSRRSSLS